LSDERKRAQGRSERQDGYYEEELVNPGTLIGDELGMIIRRKSGVETSHDRLADEYVYRIYDQSH
jgi:hypothetical protein